MDYIKWLQSAQLVADFQHFFGVEKLSSRIESEDGFSNGKALSSDSSDDDDVNSMVYARKSCKINNTQVHSAEDNRKCSSLSMNMFDAIMGQQMVGGSEVQDSHNTLLQPLYRINNWLWYYIFTAATFTGDELFYTLFIPFWLWNVDGAVMRRVVVFWMITMYIGQALKDMLRIPRPSCPPAVRLDSKWLLEYGMPSTHAAVGLALPGSVLIFSVGRYQIDWMVCSIFVALWCITVGASRIYLGMHSVLDVLCGVLLVLVLFVLLVPPMDALDHVILTHPVSPLVVFGLTVAMVAAYPATATWNPARGDTAVILGVGCGILCGAWLNYQLGIIAPLAELNGSSASVSMPPYPIMWPSVNMILECVVRTIVGLLMILFVRTVVCTGAMRALCAVMQVDLDDYLTHNSREKKVLTRVQHCFIECGYKLITYICIGFVLSTAAPAVFRTLGVERPTFYTEV